MSEFTPLILTNIQRGRDLASELNVQYIKCLRQDVKYKYKETYMSLIHILKAINFKLVKDEFDTVADLLYRKLLLLLGENQTSVTVQWGYSSVPVQPSDFVYQFSESVNIGSTETSMNFGAAVLSSDKYVFWCEPISQPLKTKWFNTNLNNGSIPLVGNPDPLLTSVIIGDKIVVYSKGVFVFDSTNTSLKITTV